MMNNRLFCFSCLLFLSKVWAQEQSEGAVSPAFNFQKEFEYNVDLDATLPSLTDKLALFNKTVVANLLTMDTLANSVLAEIAVWMGDLVYPVALAAIFVFGIYLMLNIALQVMGVALAGKVGVLAGLWQWLQAIQVALFSKLSGLADLKTLDDDDVARSAAGYPSLTDIIMLSQKVGEAVANYSD